MTIRSTGVFQSFSDRSVSRSARGRRDDDTTKSLEFPREICQKSARARILFSSKSYYNVRAEIVYTQAISRNNNIVGSYVEQQYAPKTNARMNENLLQDIHTTEVFPAQ